MAVWSSLSRCAASLGSRLKPLFTNVQSRRSMSDHKTMEIVPSRWQWNKFKDLFHMYTIIGLVPVGLIVFYTNVFIGPAKLAEIPEGYTPKHWEYYPHPITRFLSRYVMTPPQQEYEKYLHELYEQDEKMKIRRLEKQVSEKMKERSDYQSYYYLPVPGKYMRAAKEEGETMRNTLGIQ